MEIKVSPPHAIDATKRNESPRQGASRETSEEVPFANALRAAEFAQKLASAPAVDFDFELETLKEDFLVTLFLVAWDDMTSLNLSLEGEREMSQAHWCPISDFIQDLRHCGGLGKAGTNYANAVECLLDKNSVPYVCPTCSMLREYQDRH